MAVFARLKGGMGHKNVNTSLQRLVLLLLWIPSRAQVSNLTLSVEEGLPAKTIVGDLSAGLTNTNTGFFISESRDSYVFKDLEINTDTGIISTAVILDRESRDKYEFVAATLTGDVIKVEIEVNDVNDHSPIFTSEKIELEISELSPPGSRFELEGAKDQDEGEFCTQGYRIKEIELLELFKVEYRNGSDNNFNLDLILTNKLDREVNDSYSMTIEAFDGGIPARTGSIRVNIHVLDENDNPPTFDQTGYHALVSEDAPVKSTVCQVHAIDPDLSNNGLIIYEINRRQSDSSELFIINETTGMIYINKPLDFETQSFHELIISARDNGAQPEYSSTFVGVKVLNINDNKPSINVLFLSESGEAVVSEVAGIGEYIARVLVSDADLGEKESVTVTLEGGDGKFTLKQTDRFLFALCVDAMLDREEKELFELKLLASDHGSPSLSTELDIALKVTDINDCNPLFEKDAYTIHIEEDVPRGSSLVRVKALDADDGVNAAISYSILKHSQNNLFDIDPTSGLITAVGQLDREREAVLQLLVEAVDGGEPALSSTTTVTVVVEDVNDNEPVFQQQLYNVSIPEHIQIGTCFLQVQATDADGPDFGTLRYMLSDGFDRRAMHPLFQINPDTGELCVSQDIDRDAGQTTHDILVRALDQGGLSAQAYVHIEIEDLNDNSPLFNPEQYATSISSHTQPDTQVLNVIATDRDSGRYGLVTYELLSSDLSSLFTLDKDTGTLYLTATLAHLGTASVKLSITAHDGEGLTSARPAKVVVNVVSSALAAAVFQKSRYSFTVPEDAPPGTSVGIVEAILSGNSAESVTYHISSGDPQGLFSVHSESGLITSRKPLDHESQPYWLLVLLSYTGTSPVYSSTQVNVTVADVNDNPPVFPTDRDAVTVSQNTPPGTVLFIAHAHDSDSGVNGKVHYYLTPEGGGGNRTFVLDPNLGTVTLNQNLRLSAPQKYSLEILARDEGRPPLSASLTLTVNVDHMPVEDSLAFETLVYQVEIGEGYRRDARIIQVKAHQSHEAYRSSSGITYSLEPEPGFPLPPFRVHAKSGWLYLYQSLDYETEPAFRFRVLATTGDAALTNTTATATVMVTVLDANDNAPAFGSEVYYFTVSEGTSPRGLVGTVRAVDKDTRKNAQLSYFLLSDGKYFRINSKTGEISNWVALDREQHSQHALQVMVTDQGQPRLNATTMVHILVTDINDNPPQFTHLPATKELNIRVWAGLPPGSLVTTMFAKDIDAGENGTVTFSLSTDDGLFEIDSQSGDITLTAFLLQHAETRYTFEVVAQDGGLSPLEETATIHVQVHGGEALFRNSNHQIVRRFSVREDAKPATTIGSATISENWRFTYSIAEGDGSIHFGINSSSGDIYINQPLDYETATQYFLVIWAEAVEATHGMNASVFVSVLVEDINDHTPWFPDELVTFSLREDVAVGTLAFAFHAKDADGSLPNSALQYSLSFNREVDLLGSLHNAPFLLDPGTGSLTVAAPLDREANPSFAFTVTATDQAMRNGDRKQASVTAQVFLLDVNDNRPVFISSDTVQVVEDAEVGSLLHHVVAVDGDTGENGRVSYSIVAGDNEAFFKLEEKTGLLYLSSSLDHEVQASHWLTIRAVDQGLPCLSSIQSLTVKVEDVNDHPPVFQQDIYSTSMTENREPGEPVIRVSAMDKDSGENAAVWYSLLPGPGYQFFSINPQTGLVTTTTYLDREQHQHFTLRVLGRDSGTPPLSATATAVCSVLDDNDNPPEFMQSSFQISLPENLPPGVLHTVQASDPDLGENGTIRYSIQGEEDYRGCFTIDAHTGVVSTAKVLDREQRRNYTLTIQAEDSGPDPRSSFTQLHVLLLDENDNSPSFTRNHYHATVVEGLPTGTAVLQLSALDPDEGLNGEVMYSLEEDGSHGAFSVNASTGVIHTSRPLDRESRGQHTLRAVATDGCAIGPQRSVASVTIQVDDVNDNAPACGRDPINTWVAMRTPTNQIVATVKATDPDQGENGTVQFSLPEEAGPFALNNMSGEISLRRPLRAGFSGQKIQVLVADQGKPALTSTCLVFIHLKGDQDELRFTKKVYNATVTENSRTGTWIAKVDAYDQTRNGPKIGYSILSGNKPEVFAIDQNTGEITVRKQGALDFEESRQSQLVVLADNGLQTTHCRVSISLQDVNDNAPVFDYAYYRTAVWEGQVHNTYVMQVFASDADSGMNGQIEFSIVSGNHNNAFTLDPVHGILATNVLLDREITPLYKLVVQATDRGSPPLSGTTTIRVQVADVNDNSPTIPPLRPVAVAEQLPLGYIVTKVIANDVDLSSTISYSFSDNSSTEGSFAIDRYTGVITLTKALDYEEQAEHVLRVWASDCLHQTSGELLVQVLDVNDNAPVFNQISYQVELSEEAPANTLIMSLSAADMDSGLNGKVSYRLLSSPLQGFNIHPDNGSVFTNKALKEITHSNLLQLLVEARDGGDPVRSTITSIDLIILDSNDNAPLFQQETYTISVHEDAPTGTTLLTFSAEDADWAPENTHLDYSVVKGNEERRFFLEVNVVNFENQQRSIGKLVLCSPLDRETKDSYRVTITVSDRGTPPLNSSAVVIVTVTDVNDNAPVFVSTEYHAQVSENSLAGTALLRVSAHDADLGVNGLLHYEIISGNSKGHLKLDHNSGLLRVNSSLDYEEDAKYTLTIRASDGGSASEERKVAFAVVFITVTDENDNTPSFMFPTVQCSVLENLPAFSPVCSVYAIDNDSGHYGQLSYSVLSSCFMDYGSGSPERKEAFAIDPLTGDIHTRQAFDYERESEFCFVVEARDKGDKTATVRVHVTVKGVDEFSPVFTQRQYSFLLPEDAKPGQTVGHVMAMDNDGGLDGVVEYSLVSPSQFFSINRTVGSIFVSGPVYRRSGGHSTEDMVELKVSAGSSRTDSRTTTCLVSINISSSAVALIGVPLNVHMLTLCVSLITFLLLLIIFVVLVLRCKIKAAAIKKAAAIAANLNNDNGSFGRSSDNSQNATILQELKRPYSMLQKKDISNLYRHSDSSGRGSAEGETAEDQEIKWINEYPCRKRAGSLQSKAASTTPHSSTDGDCVSCHSVEVGPEHLASISTGLSTVLASAESLHHFKEEGGGEGLLPTAIRVRDLEENMRIRGYIPLSEAHASAGSLSSLVCPEDQHQGSYSWDYLLDWEPCFQPLASVFADIGMLPDEELLGGNEELAAEASSLMHPPPLITGVAQPSIRTVPPRMPGRVPTLSRRPSYPKYSYSPLARNTGLTPAAMTPSFSPSLSLLTIRTPNASPVISEMGVGGIRLDSGPLTASFLESEIQV